VLLSRASKILLQYIDFLLHMDAIPQCYIPCDGTMPSQPKSDSIGRSWTHS